MPTRTINTLQRETSQLLEKVGATSVGLRPVYHLVESDGTDGGVVDIHGEPTEVRNEDIEFRILAHQFRLLIENRKHCLLPHGRGSGATHSVGRYIIGLALSSPIRILAAREVQLSLRQSVWYLLASLIDADVKLSQFFVVQNDGIFGANGSQFIFAGIKTSTVEAIKSTEDISVCWIEEAQSISRRSVDVLIPTIRAESARFIWSINPRRADDPVHEDFLSEDRPDVSRPPQPFTIFENPLATQSLRDEAELLRTRDPERFGHVYLGGLELYSQARIFQNWIVQEINIEKVIEQRIAGIKVGHLGSTSERRRRQAALRQRIENAYGVGIDHGVADPFVIVKVYLDDDRGVLYILDEYYQRGLDPDGMLRALREFPLPTQKWPCYADHRPELNAYLSKHGFRVESAEKIPINDRIDAMRRFEIVVAPHCQHAIEELSLYSWQRDSRGVIVGDKPEDDNDHVVNGIQYGLGRRLQTKPPGRYEQLRSTFQ